MTRAERRKAGWYDEWVIGPKSMRQLQEAYAETIIQRELTKPSMTTIEEYVDAEVQ